MQAFRVERFDTGPAVTEIGAPEPGPGEVLLEIEACGLNFADLLMAKGTYQDTPEPPFTLGMEVCGIVRAHGPNVDGPAIGTRVAVFGGQGGLAEFGAFRADMCLPVPDGVPPEIAAGFQVAYGTSHLALTRRARLAAGETLAVFGAAGGVGLTAVEVGKRLGARVIAVARGADKLDVARAAGADVLIDSDAPDLRAALKDAGPIDVLYDPVGGDAFDAGFRAMAREGRILVIGFASGTVPPVPANIAMVKNIDVIGFYWGGYFKFAPEAVAASMSELLGWYAEGRLKPHVSHVFPLARAAEAFETLRARKSTGKVVVTPT